MTKNAVVQLQNDGLALLNLAQVRKPEENKSLGSQIKKTQKQMLP